MKRRGSFLLLGGLCLVLACTGDSTGPGDDDGGVVRIQIEPETVRFTTVGDTARLVAVGYDEAGDEVAEVDFDWASSDEAVAIVDAAGLVTSVDSGSVEISATVGGDAGVSGDARVDVEFHVPESTVVMDSSAATLASDSAEVAAGVLRFELNGGAPTLEPGDVIVGAERDGFIGRVQSVEISGDELVVETTPVALADAVVSGSFRGAAMLEPGDASGAGTAGGIVWGPTILESAAEGVRLEAAVLEVDGAELYDDGTVRIHLPTGRIESTPELSVSGRIEDGRVAEFELLSTGTISLVADVAVTVSGEASRSGSRTLASYSKGFFAWVGSVPLRGRVHFDLIATYDASVDATGTFQTGVERTSSLAIGARYADGEWSGIFEPEETRTSRPTTWSAEANAGVRVGLRPQVRVVFYNIVGPTAYADPYVTVDGELDLAARTWKVGVDAGIDAGLDVRLEILDRELLKYETAFDGPVSPLFRDSGRVALDSVRISPQTHRISPGSSLDLALAAFVRDEEVEPFEPVEWTSTDPAVASVDSAGVVTAAETGRASIIASVEGAVDTAAVTVRTEPLYEMTVTPSNMDLYKGILRVIEVRVGTADGEPVSGLVFRLGDAIAHNGDSHPVNGHHTDIEKAPGVYELQMIGGDERAERTYTLEAHPRNTQSEPVAEALLTVRVHRLTDVELTAGANVIQLGELTTLSATGVPHGMELAGLILYWYNREEAPENRNRGGVALVQDDGSWAGLSGTYQPDASPITVVGGSTGRAKIVVDPTSTVLGACECEDMEAETEIVILASNVALSAGYSGTCGPSADPEAWSASASFQFSHTEPYTARLTGEINVDRSIVAGGPMTRSIDEVFVGVGLREDGSVWASNLDLSASGPSIGGPFSIKTFGPNGDDHLYCRLEQG